MMTKEKVIQKVKEKLGTLSTEIVDVINFAYEAGCIEDAIKYESKAKEENMTSPCIECTFCGGFISTYPCSECCFSYPNRLVPKR
ncbi:hypothetical protein BN3087_220032 [Sulfurovum sp. enrichment culture clone C5]|uniref:Uncharacterized protein n=1 Tax=Sulfurovum sp. enrichment culture clone C5 TaxID=497650 RepID=A0A0S4XLQ2_9BACT|nr:hypothetical protein BN3087_220032 [Sulfurovum sp. enrichment culture clone C5]